VLRNPVTNIATLFGGTDIPEWSVVESGAINDQDYETMFKVYPVAHIDHIQSPILFILGDSDRRVPPSQGLNMFYALRERGIPTAVKMYPKSGHAIVSAELEADLVINSLLWYDQYTQKP
jgi:acylaminoacyl-peptidase